VGRTIGWISQWNEMLDETDRKIGRPRQLYIGESRRDYVLVEKRGV
jgi:citrate synthase